MGADESSDFEVVKKMAEKESICVNEDEMGLERQASGL
jgi:hypothetical protein